MYTFKSRTLARVLGLFLHTGTVGRDVTRGSFTTSAQQRAKQKTHAQAKLGGKHQ